MSGPGVQGELAQFLAATYVLRGLSGAASLMTGVWLARRLGPDAMGAYASVSTGLLLLSAFISPGFDLAVIRHRGSRPVAAAALRATHFQVATLIIVAAAILLATQRSAHPLAPQGVGGGLIALGGVIAGHYGNLAAAPLAAEMRYTQLNAFTLVATLVGLAGAIALALGPGAGWSLFARDLAVPLMFLLLILPLSAFPWRAGPDGAGLKAVLRFNGALWILNVLERIALRLDYALVGLLLGAEQLGVYFAVRGAVEGMTGFLVAPIQTVLFGYRCRQRDSGVPDTPHSMGRRTLGWISVLLAIPIASLLCDLAIRIGFGDSYRGARPLALAAPFLVGSTVWHEIVKARLMSRDAHGRLVAARAAQVMCVGAGHVLLTTRYGLSAAAGVTAAASAALAIASLAVVGGNRAPASAQAPPARGIAATDPIPANSRPLRGRRA